MTESNAWAEAPLGRLAEITMGQAPDSKYYLEDGDGLPFLQGCAEFQSRFPRSKMLCTQKRKIGSQGSILFSVRAPVGRINIADRDYIIGRGLAAIQGIDVDQGYLEQYLTFIAPSFSNASQGSTFEAINSDGLSSWPIGYPPRKTEQVKIAEILSTVDRAIEQTEALIAKQQHIKTGLMQDLLTRGIDEHGNLRSESTHQFKDSSLGRIPVEWDVKPCVAICRQIVVGIVIRPVQYYRPDGVSVLRSANVRENSIDPSNLVYMSAKDNETLAKSQIFTSDLVTVRTGYPGTTAVVPPEFNGCNCVDVVISRPDHGKVRSSFLSIWINSDLGKRQVLEGQGGLAQQHFNVGAMKSLLVKVPGLPEQQRIEEFLIAQRSVDDDIHRVLSKLSALKTALMQDLLTGRKRVTPLLELEPTR